MTASPDTTHSAHSEPANWPEVAQGHEVPMVCDWCHASLDEIATRGHYPPCNGRAGFHMHQVAEPVEECSEWLMHVAAHGRRVDHDEAEALLSLVKLYRFFDAAGRLLYVGITIDLGARWRNHRKFKSWWPYVASMTAEDFNSRVAALAAEKAAIIAERPLHNVVHNDDRYRSADKAPQFTLAGEAPTGSRTWTFAQREYDVQHTGSLWLCWEVNGEAITDDHHPDDVDAADLWDLWRRTLPDATRLVPISWYVVGDSTFEWAPFQDSVDGPDRDFLTEFTWPRDLATGDPLKWSALPVADKLWRTGASPQKGGFIQELTGWKPSPLQPSVNLPQLEQMARL